MSLKAINAAIADTHPEVELVRGRGYHYYVFNRPEDNIFETHSVYSPYLYMRSRAQWVDEGRKFGEIIMAALAHRTVGEKLVLTR